MHFDLILDAVGSSPQLQDAMPRHEIARAYDLVDSGRKAGDLVVRP